MLPSLGPTELIVIAIVGIVLFGKRLPEVGKSLGKAVVSFKDGLRGITDEIDQPTPATSKVRETRTGGSAPRFE
ncbi:Sec-independent protein translocase protein TatAy [Planctomycetes bacterium Pan216]|uniref:Sec-independent protein translocase protein TatA n=1 Tax=Kolteria novifilia TaxID=2527975 RepID=A0A518B159_9BACT|nr:Sec-independent protein translocase protein TatAy [Planctomycetes bacterium Pan216]